MVTKAKLLKYFDTQADIARCLSITRQAVCRWPDDAPIPREQELRLRYELRPDIFSDEEAAA